MKEPKALVININGFNINQNVGMVSDGTMIRKIFFLKNEEEMKEVIDDVIQYLGKYDDRRSESVSEGGE